MKRKSLWLLLAIEAGLFVLLRILQASFSGVFSTAMAFPFEQIGLGLRALSLSGWFGNIASFALYVAISLAPVAVIMIHVKRTAFHREDLLLAVMSATLFGVFYLMINPAIIGSLFGGAAAMTVGKAILGGTVYSLLCGYLILRILRLFFAGSTGKLQKYLATLLCLLNVLFVYLAFGACFGDLLNSITVLRAGNTGREQLLGASSVFLTLQFAVDALPYLLDVFVVFAALGVLDELQADRYSPQSVVAATRLSRLCGAALAATVLVNIAFNLLQLLFAKTLMVINSSVQIPVLSIAFVLSVLLVARFIAENKQLKDENDMFV